MVKKELTKKLFIENEVLETQPILRVQNINKYFNKGGIFFKALDDVSFNVYPGDFFGIIGESGSGKSTTGKCIIRLCTTSGGAISFDGHLINQKNISKKTKSWLTTNMQMIFQDPMSSLNPKKNVLSLISEPLIINKSIDKEANKLLTNHLSINKCFKYEFKINDNVISKKYLTEYYLEMIDNYKYAIEKINEFKPNKNKKSIDEMNRLLGVVLDFENDYKTSTTKLYGYKDAIIDLYKTKLQEFQSLNINKTEATYFKLEKELLELQKQIKQSPQYYVLHEKSEIIKKELKEYQDDITVKYYEQNVNLYAAITDSYKKQISIFKQQIKISKSITENYIAHIKLKMYKRILNLFSLFSKFIYVEQTDIYELNVFLINFIDQKYKKIMSNISLLEILGEEIDEIITIENNLIPTDENYEIKKQKYLEDKSIKSKQYRKIQLELADLIKKDKSISYLNSSVITKKITKIKHDSQVTKKQIDEKLSTFKKKIHSLKNKVEQHKFDKSFLDSDEYIELKEKYENTIIIHQESKDEYDKYMDDRIRVFKNDSKIEINATKKDLARLKREFHKYQNKFEFTFNEQSKNIKNCLLSNSKLSFVEKIRRKKDVNNIIKREYKTKVKNLKSFEFEFETIIEVVQLYRSLRTTNKPLLYANKRFLKTILARDKVYVALDEVGLKKEHAYRYPHEFSGGQRQRIVIARSLITNPKIIIADEPISALDVSIQAQVLNIMKKLSKEKGVTFIFIAHDLSVVNYICNRLIIMHKGKIVEKGNTNEIFRNPIHPYTVSLIKASPSLSKIHVNLAEGSIELDYQKEYTAKNIPKFYSISDEYEHQVLATKGQIEKWIKD